MVLDSDWEAEFCRIAESHPKVVAYTKNHNLGLEVPYRYGSAARSSHPAFHPLPDVRTAGLLRNPCDPDHRNRRERFSPLPKSYPNRSERRAVLGPQEQEAPEVLKKLRIYPIHSEPF